MKKLFTFLSFALFLLSSNCLKADAQELVYLNEPFVFEGASVQSVAYYYSDFPYELIYNRLSMSNLYGLNCWELRVLRNAIYAYHGYIFKSDDLRRFFNGCSWYYPRYKSESKVFGMMSKTEKYNIELIKKRERQLGC